MYEVCDSEVTGTWQVKPEAPASIAIIPELLGAIGPQSPQEKNKGGETIAVRLARP